MHVLTHNCSVNEQKRQNYAGTLILLPTDNIIIVNNVFTSTAHGYVRNVLQMYMYVLGNTMILIIIISLVDNKITN